MYVVKKPKLFNLEQYYGKRNVATLHYNLPYAIIKFKKRTYEIDPKFPKGTYFKIIENKVKP